MTIIEELFECSRRLYSFHLVSDHRSKMAWKLSSKPTASAASAAPATQLSDRRSQHLQIAATLATPGAAEALPTAGADAETGGVKP